MNHAKGRSTVSWHNVTLWHIQNKAHHTILFSMLTFPGPANNLRLHENIHSFQCPATYQAEIWTVYLLSTWVCSIWKPWPTYFHRVTLNTHPRSWLHFCYLVFERKWIMNLHKYFLASHWSMSASDWLTLCTISSLQIGSLFGDINIW